MIQLQSFETCPVIPSLASGFIKSVGAQTVTASIPDAALGDLCLIRLRDGSQVPAQIVAFQEDRFILAPFSNLNGVRPGAEVITQKEVLSITAPTDPRGSVLDALGSPLSGRSFEESSTTKLPLQREPLPAMQREIINQQIITGIPAIDTFLPIGYGQRIGLFAGPGAGKSTLLGNIARNAEVDSIVIALVGERGREVREFVEHTLGREGLKRSVVIATTSDDSPIRRKLAPYTATAIAEHLAEQGERVLLLVDSITRTARAIREVTIATGEVPIRQGFTNSVYTELPRLIERAGKFRTGSVTAIYTLLTQEDMENDALAEEVKSLLDGHFVLTQEIAARGIRPAIDITRSISRLACGLISGLEWTRRARFLSLMSRLEHQRDLISLGATPDPQLKAMLSFEPELVKFLNGSHSNLQISIDELLSKFESTCLQCSSC